MAKEIQNMPRDKKIVSYMEMQLKLKKERLKTFETPIDPETIKDVRKMEELMLKKEIWLLEDILEQVKFIE